MKEQVIDLWQGTSTQPDWKKFKGQCRSASNFVLDVAHGARKRNPLVLVADISGSVLNSSIDWYVTTLREYRIFIADAMIKILDADGAEVSVTDSAGDAYAYISGASRSTIRTASSIDTIVVVNTSKTVRMRQTPTYTVAGEVDVYSNLFKAPEDAGDANPLTAGNGSVFKVISDENNDVAGYYQKSSDGWTRIAAPGDTRGRARVESWPHRLVFNPDTSTFSWDEIPFNDRLSGNDTTNPAPGFVDSKILDVQFHLGRLMFIGREQVFETAAQDIFTIFQNNVNQLVDSDPIEIDITNRNVGVPLNSAVVGQGVLIDCERGQLSYQYFSDTLTPQVPPVLHQVGSFSSYGLEIAASGERCAVMDADKLIRVFVWNAQNRSVSYVGSPNEHVHGIFAEKDIDRIFMDGTTTFVLSSNSLTPNEAAWIHDMYFNGDGSLAQSAWSIFAPTGGLIIYMDRWDDRYRCIQDRTGDGYSFLTYQHIRNVEPEFEIEPTMDRLESVTGSYDPVTDTTVFEHSGMDASASSRVYDPETGVILSPIEDSLVDGRFSVYGRWESEVQIGFVYSASMTLAYVYAGASGDRVILRRLVIFHFETTDYKVTVTPQGESAETAYWDGRILNSFELDASVLQDGEFEFVVLGDGKNTQITVSNDSPGRFTFSAFEIVADRKGRG